jgi:hypothetical protein
MVIRCDVLTLTLAAAILAGCGGGQSQQSGAAIPTALKTAGSLNDVTHDTDFGQCGGEHGVRVRPCPVTFTEPKQKIYVTVSGPGVVSSGNYGGCGGVCSFHLVKGDFTKWELAPTATCGKVIMLFGGDRANYTLVGNAHLRVINKSC